MTNGTELYSVFLEYVVSVQVICHYVYMFMYIDYVSVFFFLLFLDLYIHHAPAWPDYSGH